MIKSQQFTARGALCGDLRLLIDLAVAGHEGVVQHLSLEPFRGT